MNYKCSPYKYFELKIILVLVLVYSIKKWFFCYKIYKISTRVSLIDLLKFSFNEVRLVLTQKKIETLFAVSNNEH